MEWMQAGGGIMWAIAALSVLAGAVVLERLWFFFRAWADPEELEERLGRALYDNDQEGVRRVVSGGRSSLHRLFSAATSHWQVEAATLKLLLEQEIRRELYRWERGLALVATVGRLAPLLGLLGTVLGMVEIFQTLPSAREAPMVALAGGIWKALLTTVAGLVVAVPAVLFHTFLLSRVDRIEETLERGADFVLREKLLGRGTDRGA